MQILQIRNWIYLLAICVIFNACKKRNENCNGFVEYSSIMKDYLLFKDSSYWIYKDSVTGIMDTTEVFNYSRKDIWPYKETGNKDCPCYETFYYQLKSKYQMAQVVQLSVIPMNNPVDRNGLIFEFDHGILDKSNKWFIRFVSKGDESIMNETPVESGYINRFDSMMVHNIVYKDIIYLYYPKIVYSDNVRNIAYAKNIGAVKYTDDKGRVWELVNYKVVQ